MRSSNHITLQGSFSDLDIRYWIINDDGSYFRGDRKRTEAAGVVMCSDLVPEVSDSGPLVVI